MTFDQYLTQNEHLTFAEMTQLHAAILATADETNEDFSAIWHDIILAASRYTEIRASWNLLTTAEKMARDAARTRQHNVIIDDFLILERIFTRNNWANTWSDRLFLEPSSPERKKEQVAKHRQRIGDFANYLAFVSALNGR